MEWFSQNWVWVLFFAGLIAMHMFGHGGHGGHGGTVDTAVGVAVAIMTPSPQAKTVCNALRNKGRVINIDPLDIGF